jgi:hypothetical protein
MPPSSSLKEDARSRIHDCEGRGRRPSEIAPNLDKPATKRAPTFLFSCSESEPGARRMDPAWVMEIRDQDLDARKLVQIEFVRESPKSGVRSRRSRGLGYGAQVSGLAAGDGKESPGSEKPGYGTRDTRREETGVRFRVPGVGKKHGRVGRFAVSP